MELDVIRIIMERDFKRTEKTGHYCDELEVHYSFVGVFEERTISLSISATYCIDSWLVEIESDNPKFLHYLTTFDYRVERDGSCRKSYQSIEDAEENLYNILKDYRSDLAIVRDLLS